MSRLAKAIEILEAIKTHFDEGADCVYRDGLILSDDSTLHEAITDCLGEEEKTTPVIPHSKRKKVGKNFYGQWGGFIGKNKVEEFSDEAAAWRWLNG